MSAPYTLTRILDTPLALLDTIPDLPDTGRTIADRLVEAGLTDIIRRHRTVSDLLSDHDLTPDQANVLVRIVISFHPPLSRDVILAHFFPDVPRAYRICTVPMSELMSASPLGPGDDLFDDVLVRLLSIRPLSLANAHDLVILAVPQAARHLRAHRGFGAGELCPRLFTPEALDYLLSPSPAATATTRGMLAAMTPLSDAQFIKLLIILDPKRPEFELVLSPHVTSPLRLRLTVASLSPLWQTARPLAWMEQVPLTDDLVRRLSPHLGDDVIDQYLLRTLISSLGSPRTYPTLSFITELLAGHPHHPFSLITSAPNAHLPRWYLARLCLSVPGLAYLILEADQPGRATQNPHYNRILNFRDSLEALLSHLDVNRAALASLLSDYTTLSEVLAVLAVHELVP